MWIFLWDFLQLPFVFYKECMKNLSLIIKISLTFGIHIFYPVIFIEIITKFFRPEALNFTVHSKQVTRSMQNSPPLRSSSFSESQEFPRILCHRLYAVLSRSLNLRTSWTQLFHFAPLFKMIWWWVHYYGGTTGCTFVHTEARELVCWSAWEES
jgi:hypothetical protein